jgi:hypothetical protein
MVEVSDDCGENYETETDAFGDGGMTYYVGFLADHSERCEGAD